jgi:hypothetical protein
MLLLFNIRLGKEWITLDETDTSGFVPTEAGSKSRLGHFQSNVGYSSIHGI